MQLVKQFYSDQQGVYMIMTGLLSFILLGVIALSVDGSGLLLDKARLQQGTEQAACGCYKAGCYECRYGCIWWG